MKKLLVSLKGRLLKSTSAISICSLVYHIHTRAAVDAKPDVLQIILGMTRKAFKKWVKIKLRKYSFLPNELNNFF